MRCCVSFAVQGLRGGVGWFTPPCALFSRCAEVAEVASLLFTPRLPWLGSPLRCISLRLQPQRRCLMLLHAADPLFARGELEDCPSLSTIRELLQALPDAPLLDGLQAARGR